MQAGHDEENEFVVTSVLGLTLRLCTVREEGGQYVELDLACGLFDLKDEAAIAAAERSLINQGVAVEDFGGDSSSESEASSSENEASPCPDEEGLEASAKISIDADEVHAAGAQTLKDGTRPARKKPGRRHPGIQELS